jgi:hypothetical protein
VETLGPEVLDDLRHGRAPRERKIAVCSTGAHIPPVDLVEILAVLARDSDEMISERAQEALLTHSHDMFIPALKREHALPALFAYAGKNLGNYPAVVDAMLANRNCGGEHLVHLARHLSSEHIQLLLDELDRVSATPALVLALEHAPSLTANQKLVLHELRSASLPGDDKALAEAAAEAEPDPGRRQTLLQQIAKMTVSQRVQFAIKGGADARRTLIRDGSKVVQRAVIQSPRLTEQEVEAFASMANLTDEILRLIANNRNFRKNYIVVRNLMNNPKTPIDVSLHMLPMVNAVDLKKLSMNKNIPDALRTAAVKLIRTRADQKG